MFMKHHLEFYFGEKDKQLSRGLILGEEHLWWRRTAACNCHLITLGTWAERVDTTLT
jgi:hypothetical protein